MNCMSGFLFPIVRLSDFEGPLDFHGHNSWFKYKATLIIQVHLYLLCKITLWGLCVSISSTIVCIFLHVQHK